MKRVRLEAHTSGQRNDEEKEKKKSEDWKVTDAPDAVSGMKIVGRMDKRKIVLIGYTAGKHA